MVGSGNFWRGVVKNGGESGELGSIAQISLYVKEEKGKISTLPPKKWL